MSVIEALGNFIFFIKTFPAKIGLPVSWRPPIYVRIRLPMNQACQPSA
jgi:hypothetical protein